MLAPLRFGRLALLSGLLSVSLVPANAAASYYIRYEGTLPGPTGFRRLSRPTAVTVNRVSREVCVSDGGAVAFHVYNGQNIHTFGTEEVARLSSPRDGSIDFWGGFVFTDRRGAGGRTIRRLNFFGEPVAYEPERPYPAWAPGHLLVTRDGDYVTVDERTSTIARHDGESGALLWSRDLWADVPSQGALVGRPAEGPDGKIYLPGGELRAIYVLSAGGDLVASFGTPGAGRGELAFPVGVAFGMRGMILVLDRMRHAILLYDPDYRFLGEFGRPGSRPGSFYHPVAIAALPDGRIWVAQGYEGRVQAFRLLESESSDPSVRRIAS